MTPLLSRICDAIKIAVGGEVRRKCRRVLVVAVVLHVGVDPGWTIHFGCGLVASKSARVATFVL